jgi:hypothetical protein
MERCNNHGGKREGAGRKASGKVGKSYYLTLSQEATEKLKSVYNKSEYIDRLISNDIKQDIMSKTITKREALIHIAKTYIDYATQYEGWDDGETLRYAIEVINKVDGDSIEADDVKGFGTPYTDRLWEDLQ